MSRDPSDVGGGTEVKRWIGSGGAVYWAGAASVAGYIVRKEVPFDGASLEHISNRESSRRCRFFIAWEMSFWDLLNGE